MTKRVKRVKKYINCIKGSCEIMKNDNRWKDLRKKLEESYKNKTSLELTSEDSILVLSVISVIEKSKFKIIDDYYEVYERLNLTLDLLMLMVEFIENNCIKKFESFIQDYATEDQKKTLRKFVYNS